MSWTAQIELRDFLNKQKGLIKIEALSKAVGADQKLRRFLSDRVSYFDYTDKVNVELVKLYESLGKYLNENKIIEPKGLFK
jgi:hypothetical protein